MASTGADLGLALDGDADRAIFIDGRGQVVDGDQIMNICARNLHKKGHLNKNTMAATIMSNMGVDIALKKHGIKYARTVAQTLDFKLPNDPFELNPTCHYNNARLFELAKAFAEEETDEPRLFYVWGHAYELDGYDNWGVIKHLCEYLSKQKKILFGTNSEILKINR